MALLVTNIGQLVTVRAEGARVKVGEAMQELGIVHDAAMVVEERILWVGPKTEAYSLRSTGLLQWEAEWDVGGRVVIPGFVDAHTHMVFSGSRVEEYSQRLRGATYAEIAAAGGGIMTTVRTVRATGEEELFRQASALLWSALQHGTTTAEIKSGYGLTTADELKLLRVIRRLAQELPLRIVPTFMGAHAFPPEYRNCRSKYIELICQEMLPAVAAEGLAEYCDVFVDEGYFTPQEAERILRTAQDYGLRPRLHADELAPVGAAELAARVGAVSADHLLHVSDAGIAALRSAGTIAVLLPGTAYTLRLPYAPARRLIAAGVPVALATDCNPGSCFCENMQVVLSLACQCMGMLPEEALVAATLNGAAALERSHLLGSLEVGKYADFLVLRLQDVREMVYHFGVNHVAEVWIGGRCVWKASA
ncbi:MAG: imidazolonepropionase [Candidatus Kapabacteria bacterium]|nr:imidazolonepropionase [Candidatus Kapabacteria bacterium]MDW8012456.1 imidazolonepropionase [Bacteroidota bacterium]